jgi:hypothetical protein
MDNLNMALPPIASQSEVIDNPAINNPSKTNSNKGDTKNN